MKTTRKKLASVLLALVMVLSLTVPALALTNNKCTVTFPTGADLGIMPIADDPNSTPSTRTWAGYQLLYLNVDADETHYSYTVNEDYRDVLKSAIESLLGEDDDDLWDTSSSEDNIDAAIIKYISELDDDTIQDFAQAVYAEIKEDDNLSADETITGGKADVGQGYWLFADVTEELGDGEAYSLILLDTKGLSDLEITVKGTVPEVDKDIVDDEGDAVTDGAYAIGDTIQYQITGTLPNAIASYKEYYYVFTDTMTPGLTLDWTAKTNPGDKKGNVESGIKVYVVNGATETEVTDYFYKNVEVSLGQDGLPDRDGTTITVGIQDLKALSLLKFDADGNVDQNNGTALTIDKDTTIVVKYSAELNANAILESTGNPNKVVLSYSNDPSHSGDGAMTPPDPDPEDPDDSDNTPPTGKTPEEDAVTYTVELVVEKVDEKNDALSGAAFTLSGSGLKMVVITGEVFVAVGDGYSGTEAIYYKLTDGTYTETDPEGDGVDTSVYEKNADDGYTKYIKETTTTIETESESTSVTAFVGETTGKVTFKGLGVGTYTLSETVTPAGYNTISDIEFTISFDADTKTFSLTSNDIEKDDDYTFEGSTLTVTVVNTSGTLLPSTGGMGTTIFYVVGSVLVIGAAVLLVTKKRMKSEEE